MTQIGNSRQFLKTTSDEKAYFYKFYEPLVNLVQKTSNRKKQMKINTRIMFAYNH